MPRRWLDFPEQGREVFKALRSPAGERMVLDDNFFVEVRLPARSCAR
jgi:haloalkane dehalogenase